MKFEIRESWEQSEADLLVVPILEGADGCDPRFAAPADSLFKSGDLPLKANETLLIPGNPRTLYVGVGKADDAEAWRRAAATVVRRVKKTKKIAFAARHLAAATEGALTGSFSTDRYKTSDISSKPEGVAFLYGEAADVERGRIFGESINWARQIINEKPPRVIANLAQEMAASAGLECDVLDEKRIEELRMGALLGVSRGSDEPPRVVVLRHRGKPGSNRLLSYVGKGITFDSGGISIKPADGMERMKYDMAGGATAMATMRALALLKAPVECMAVIPLAENMPGGKAQRPGDVVRSMSGKTIEIINTDAEGRLILADGLAYARQLGATHLIDMATLTGAIRVALGPVRIGVMGNRQDYVDQLLAAAQRAGERMWQLPLDDEYRDLIKSSIADVANSGGRFAGAITAGKFLQEFVGDLPWIHIDIAGIAWNEEEKPYLGKGPSGVAIRTLIEFGMGFDAA